MIESKGRCANTFRIRSTGYGRRAREQVRQRVTLDDRDASRVTGFLDYVYYTNYETIDPASTKSSDETAGQ